MTPVVEPMRLFPIMAPRYGGQVSYIPWSLIAPHEARAQRNHSQTLERLAERGGLSAFEAVCCLTDKDLFGWKCSHKDAWRIIWEIGRSALTEGEKT